MRIVFMGTPEFAVPSLNILLESGYPVEAVVTVPDKPSGRGRQLSSSAVKEIAVSRGLPVLQPAKLAEEGFVRQISALRPDLIIVVAFRILPASLFTIPVRGAFNLHASLLPRYRGAAPIQWAVMNGEKETGVTTFFLQEKVDVGNIILQARIPIGDEETAGEVHDRLAAVGAEIVLHTVRLIEAGKASTTPQDDRLATPAPKITKEHCHVRWQADAAAIVNTVRGLAPRPAAFTTLDDVILKLYRLRQATSDRAGVPGEILSASRSIVVQSGTTPVEILELQQEGKKKMTAEEYLRGHSLTVGTIFR